MRNLRLGFGALQGDHKYIKSRTNEDQKNGIAVLVTISCEEIFASLTLDFRATDSTSYETTKSDFEDILSVSFEVDFAQSLKVNFAQNFSAQICAKLRKIKDYGLLPLWQSKLVALIGDSKFSKFEDDSDFMVVCLLHTINRIVDSMQTKAFIFGIDDERFKAVDSFICAIAKLRKPHENSPENCPRTVNGYLKKLSEQGVPEIDKKKILRGRMRYPERKLTAAEVKEDTSVKKFPKFRVRLRKIYSILILLFSGPLS